MAAVPGGARPAHLAGQARVPRPHQEKISQAGILALAPGQPNVFYPFADLTAIEETSRAFYLSDQTGVAVVLPKRGLPDASLIPGLRAFLHRAVAGGADQAATTD